MLVVERCRDIHIKVRNCSEALGIDRCGCPAQCQSWKEHWMNTTGNPFPQKCSNIACNSSEKIMVAPVKKQLTLLKGMESGPFLVPLCLACMDIPTVENIFVNSDLAGF